MRINFTLNFKTSRSEISKCRYTWYSHTSSQFVMVKQTLCEEFYSFQRPSPSPYVASVCARILSIFSYHYSLMSAGFLCDLSVIFVRMQNLVTIFVILCESRNVMTEEFECHRKDVTKMTSHRNSVSADTIL